MAAFAGGGPPPLMAAMAQDENHAELTGGKIKVQSNHEL
jgi:hypothetical protein